LINFTASATGLDRFSRDERAGNLGRVGFQWPPLSQDLPFLRPEVGGRLMRDPSLARGPDGRFHLVWTTSWTAESGKVFVYSSSTNLVDWAPQRAIEVMQDEPSARNIWAPELFFDGQRQQWLALWSTTIPGGFPATDDSGDDGCNHHLLHQHPRFSDLCPIKALASFAK
jgi:hypothetical protein